MFSWSKRSHCWILLTIWFVFIHWVSVHCGDVRPKPRFSHSVRSFSQRHLQITHIDYCNKLKTVHTSISLTVIIEMVVITIFTVKLLLILIIISNILSVTLLNLIRFEFSVNKVLKMLRIFEFFVKTKIIITGGASRPRSRCRDYMSWCVVILLVITVRIIISRQQVDRFYVCVVLSSVTGEVLYLLMMVHVIIEPTAYQ